MSQAQIDGRERLTRVISAFSLAVSLVYIVWRWGWTLDTDALWFSVPLALAETYGLLTAFFLTFVAWRLERRSSPPVEAGRAIDVFVTVCDEPITVVRTTALAARAMHHPHQTYLLDDGRREEVRALAGELGVGYLRRDEAVDGKAGNLNHALGHSHGELILLLDADHVPLPDMLDRLSGFFADERLAFAQSPRDFDAADAFTGDTGASQRTAGGDQEIFYRVLQPGRDRMNAALFVGSCVMIRRAAVEDIGGFPGGATNEDIETSLLLHSRGWRSVYLDENLAFGLVPASARTFHERQLAWGQAAMQVLRRYRPLAMGGLTTAQRIAYLDLLTTSLTGFQRLILYLTPIAFLATGVFPLRVRGALFAALFVPHVLLRMVSYRLLTRGHGSLLLAERYAMAGFFTRMMAALSYLTRKELTLRGGPASPPLRTAAPQLVVVLLTLGALTWALYWRLTGADYLVPGWGSAALWTSVALALWSAGVAAYVVQLTLSGRHRRSEHRFAESLSVRLRVIRDDGKLSSTDIAVTENLTPSGLALRCMYPIPEGARVELALPLSTREIAVRGRVVRQGVMETQMGTVHLAGVEFDTLTQDARDAIELHLAQHAMPMERQRQGTATARRALERLRDLRGERRMTIGMPTNVSTVAESGATELGVGLLEDVSPRGGRVLLDHPVAENTVLTLSIPGSTVKAGGRVVFVRALETSLGVRYLAGFQTDRGKRAPVPPRATDAPTGTPTLGDASGAEATPWFAGIGRLASRYAAAAAAGTRSVGAAMNPARLRRAVAAEPPASPPAPLLAGSTVAETAPSRSRAARAAVRRGTSAAISAMRAAGQATLSFIRRVGARSREWTRAMWDTLRSRSDAGDSATTSSGGSALGLGRAVRATGTTMLATSRATGEFVVQRTRQLVAVTSEESRAAARLAGAKLTALLPSRREAPIRPMPVIADEPTPPNALDVEPAAPDVALGERGGIAAPEPVDQPTVAEPASDSEAEWEINGEFSFPMELSVGGTFVVGEHGRVTADISTVDAIIHGSYRGSLRASGVVYVASTGRASGRIEGPQVVIAEGAVVDADVVRTGSRDRGHAPVGRSLAEEGPGDTPAAVAEAGSASVEEPVSEPTPPEEPAERDVEIFIPPRGPATGVPIG